jgi:hypothetical protein
MKRLFIVLMVLALMVTTTGLVLAGVDWDGDPVLLVGGTTVNVDFGFEGDFLADGGRISVLAVAPQIRLLFSEPYVTTKVRSGGERGHLLITTTLSKGDAPETFQVRVSVPSKRVEKIFTVKNRETIDFEMPR